MKESIDKTYFTRRSDKYSMVPHKVVVSLTSFPARIGYVSRVVRSLLNQSYKADKLILWLAETEFPHHHQDLPEDLIELESHGLSIRYCENIGPHKKYFFAMKEYPDSIIITVDDDVEYPAYLIEDLIQSYLAYPFAVSATFAHLVTFDEECNLKPYSQWIKKCDNAGRPSLALMGIGIGGILYPPHCMDDEVFNLKSIKELCFYADDLWLKIMQVARLTPVVVAGRHRGFKNIDGTQEQALYYKNLKKDQNTTWMNNILERYNFYFDKECSLLFLMWCSSRNISGSPLELNLFDLKKKLNEKDRELKLSNKSFAESVRRTELLSDELNAIRESRSYKVGRLVTAPFRIFKNLLKHAE